jgi:hypothetical protein
MYNYNSQIITEKYGIGSPEELANELDLNLVDPGLH